MIRSAGATHVGMKPCQNNDNFALHPTQNLFIIADGQGGTQGEVASQLVLDSIMEHDFTNSSEKDREQRLIASIKAANQKIFAWKHSSEKYRDMHSTVVASHISENKAIIAHVGHSRAYYVRKQAIRQITEDHTLLNDYLRVHPLTPEEIEAFPNKGVLTRALGSNPDVPVDINTVDLVPGDVLLLCSDGLFTEVTDEGILSIISQFGVNLEKACQELIGSANNSGGRDNITAVLVFFEK